MNGTVVLVTGGAGYIGSHTCKVLAQAGYTPVSYDNLVYGHSWAVRWGPLEQGDIADRAKLDELIARYHPAAVMHFAAYAYVGESVVDPGKYYRNNVAGTLTLLEAVRDHDIRHFIFSSTCATYGFPQQVPLAETHPQQPINPYGASKLMIERMLDDFGTAHGLRAVALRYFNAAGADPDGELGEEHDPETHLIPLALQALLGQRAELAIFGTDYPTDDGTAIRDYIHVADLADAHVKALRCLEQGGASTALPGYGSGLFRSGSRGYRRGRQRTARPDPYSPTPARRSTGSSGRRATRDGGIGLATSSFRTHPYHRNGLALARPVRHPVQP